MLGTTNCLYINEVQRGAYVLLKQLLTFYMTEKMLISRDELTVCCMSPDIDRESAGQVHTQREV